MVEVLLTRRLFSALIFVCVVPQGTATEEVIGGEIVESVSQKVGIADCMFQENFYLVLRDVFEVFLTSFGIHFPKVFSEDSRMASSAFFTAASFASRPST